MKKKLLLLCSAAIMASFANAQGPEVTSWIQNTTATNPSYPSLVSNCQLVQYSATQVYVSCSCIPGYSIGPWTGNPNTPANQNFVFKITRTPQQNTGTLTAVGLGHIGVWKNGVSIFNVSDAMSYNNAGVWFRNAYFWEGPGFDACLGHPQQQGEYHHHVSPTCLYDQTDSTHHSPVIGYAFDGFPVYGAYAYTNANGTGAIKRMTSSYAMSTNTTRANGPAVNSTYPEGCFIQDFTYVAGSGDLDDRNGRFCITPEYPAGTYAYFVTIDNNLNPVFPYTFYGTYYGVVQTGNTGPGGGHVTISETTTVYSPVATGLNESNNDIKFDFMPNPVQDYAYIYFSPESKNNIKGSLYDAKGQLVQTIENMQPSISYTLDMTKYSEGMYFLHLESGDKKVIQKIIKTK
jgi:YHYH protein/Secretion system C-terminal sorting domain